MHLTLFRLDSNKLFSGLDAWSSVFWGYVKALSTMFSTELADFFPCFEAAAQSWWIFFHVNFNPLLSRGKKSSNYIYWLLRKICISGSLPFLISLRRRQRLSARVAEILINFRKKASQGHPSAGESRWAAQCLRLLKEANFFELGTCSYWIFLSWILQTIFFHFLDGEIDLR